MSNLETLKNELITQKSVLETKGYNVDVANTNPSPSEITTAIRGVMANDPNLNAYSSYFKTLLDPDVEGAVINDIVLPNNITKIRPYLFYTMGSYLTGTVNIPESCKQIGTYSFYTTDISEVNFPEGLEKILNYAFRKCINIKKVILPDSLTELGAQAFNEVTELTELHFGTGITTITSTNFKTLNVLKELTIPANITAIAVSNFYECPSLENLYILGSELTISNASFLGTHNNNLKVWVNFDNFFYFYNLTNMAKVNDHIISKVELTSADSFPTIVNLPLNWYASIEDATNNTNILTAPTGDGTYYCKAQ